MLQTDILPPQYYAQNDNWNLEIACPKYPPSKGYVMTLTIIPVVEGPNFVLVSDPTIPGELDKHLIAFVGADIATLNVTPGDFRGQSVITLPSDASVRYTYGLFDLSITPDLGLVSEGYDPRSYNEKCLAALELVISGQASRDLMEYTFKDASFKYKSMSELITLRNYFMVQVDREQGKKPGRYITKALYRPSYWGI